MRRLQLILLFVGIALFIVVVRRVGVDAIFHGVAQVGWLFFGIFAVEILIDLLHSEGWRWCLPGSELRISRANLLAARTAGFAVNILTPTATVGGEVVKGMLIRPWVPLVDGFASVMVDKLSFAIGQAIFLLVGLLTVFQSIPFNDQERELAVVAVTLWFAAVGAFFALQRAGIFRVGMRAMRALFGGAGMIGRVPGHAAAFDARVTSLLDHRLRFSLSVLFHVLGQAARALQFWIALTALGFRPDLAECFTTAGGFVFVEATLFLVPGKLGVLEGGQVLLFSALGYGAAAGLTVSFVLHLSELASALLGLGALGYFHFRYPATEGPPEEVPAAPETTEVAPERRRRALS